uniref:Alpha-ketoglutarate-dependent dioxygenase AlkB-like domain-containing protein n=1 Tax=Rhizophora mucronata TaxID=61149 RepID=A0A2P2ISL7_RHIMU
MRFEDGIAIVSLESSCIMHFTKSGGGVSDNEKGEQDGHISRIPVYLNPGSLVLLSGEARYLWKHEINRKPGFQMWGGQELNQERRTSITLRKLCTVE